MKKGSVTVFFSLILLLLCSLFFSMVETTRILALGARADAVTHVATGSLFSEYDRALYETYQILGVDTSYGGAYTPTSYMGERLLTFCDENGALQRASDGTNFLQVIPSTASMKEIRLLTDDNGLAFMQQAADIAKKLATEDVLAELSGASDTADTLSGSDETEEKVQQAEDAMEHPEDYATDEEVELTETAEVTITEENNPITLYQELISKSWLDLVTDGAQISENAMETTDVVSKRTLDEGTAKTDVSGLSAADQVLYLWYLKDTFGDFLEPDASGALTYGLEYIVAGKSSDRENLESVINRLLLLRQVANMATIVKTESMMAECHQVALAVAAITGNPAIVAIVQTAVIAVWALVESILDLRTILNGGKVAAIKTKADWTSSVTNLSSALSSGGRAKESEHGISYLQYVCGMLLLLPAKAKGLRPLDLIESTLLLSEDASGLRMDEVACEVTVDVVYESNPMFLFMVEGVSEEGDWYRHCSEETISYQ